MCGLPYFFSHSILHVGIITSMKFTHKKLLIALAVCIGAAGFYFTVYFSGVQVARMTGGRYSPVSAIADTLLYLVLLGCIVGLNFIFQMAASRLNPDRKGRRKLMLSILTISLTIFLVIPLGMVVMQVFPKKVGCTITPGDVGLEYRDVTLTSDSRRIAGWYVPGERPESPVVVIGHGYGANRQNFMDAVELMHSMGLGVMTIDFRAHGNSSGMVSSFGFHEVRDVKAAYDWVQANTRAEKIFALGYSMGAAAVLKASADFDIFDRVILDSCFCRAENVARDSLLNHFGPLKGVFWQMGRFWAWIFTGVDLEHHDMRTYLKKIADTPVLIIHGREDRLSPVSESELLYREGSSRHERMIIENVGHVQGIAHDSYKIRIQSFLGLVPAK